MHDVCGQRDYLDDNFFWIYRKLMESTPERIYRRTSQLNEAKYNVACRLREGIMNNDNSRSSNRPDISEVFIKLSMLSGWKGSSDCFYTEMFMLEVTLKLS